MIKVVRILNPSILKEGDIVLSLFNGDTISNRRINQWFTFKVRGNSIRFNVDLSLNAEAGSQLHHIEIHDHPLSRVPGYFFRSCSEFYRLNREIGWFWQSSYNNLIRNVGYDLNINM